MTQPAPTPAAPAPTPVPPTPAVPVPTPPPTTAPAPWTPDALPPEAKTWLDAQVAAADKKSRLDTKANAANEVTAKIAEALGLKPSAAGPPTVESLATQLTEMQARLEAADARNEEAATVAQLSATAARLGANAEALLDSRRFVDKLNAIDADTEPAYNAAVEKLITAELTANPALKSGGQPAPPPSGADFAGTGGQPGPLTEAQLDQMTPQQIAEAYKNGQLKHLL